jgi:S-DNA-T family DNA segregation ATPase FtsK/SpoIIIE
MSKNRVGTHKKNKHSWSDFLTHCMSEGTFILVLTGLLFMFLSLVTFEATDPGWFNTTNQKHTLLNAGGTVGAYLSNALYGVLGYFALLLPFCLAYVARVSMKGLKLTGTFMTPELMVRGAGFLFFLLSFCGLCALNQPFNMQDEVGGLVGSFVSSNLAFLFGTSGAALMLFAMFLAGVTWLTGISWLDIAEYIGMMTEKAVLWCVKGIQKLYQLKKQTEEENKPVQTTRRPSLSTQPVVKAAIVKPDSAPPLLVATPEKISAPPVKVAPKETNTRILTTTLPQLSLLDKGLPGKPMGGFTHQELEMVSKELEQHLLDFGIHADVVAVHPGPVITRFELQLAAGIKVSKLTTLAKDLARSLSVISVRVVEVIPGKTVVGLELPNQHREMVRLSEVLTSPVYQQAYSPLTIALGVDIAGHPMVVDLGKMPHLLVAGTTGSGKSVGINAMILSLLFKATPEQVRLIMIDPKMLELSVYDGIPHLLTPVVTDMKEAASALRWCVGEMERRYKLMSALGVRNLAGYNTKIADGVTKGEKVTDPLWKPTDSVDDTAPYLEQLPYIVVIIDELADMMMVVGKKVEQLIARIAQKARAAGIHLVLATQRPSVDVLTGLIKSNIPTRISFQVSSKIDSRTILDQQGAEQLLGHGDMLYLAPGSGAPLRVHGAFVDDEEVHRIADDWRARGEPNYIESITRMTSDNFDGGEDEASDVEEADPLFDQAVEFVLQTRKASISAVQRRLKIGYNRAARIVEEMERVGIVGPLDGGYRDVLVTSVTEE